MPRLIVIEERGRLAVEVAAVTLGEILAEWKTYLGTRSFTLLHQILEQLREITDPSMRWIPGAPSRPHPIPVRPGSAGTGRRARRPALRSCVLRRIDAEGMHERIIDAAVEWYAVLTDVFHLNLGGVDASARARCGTGSAPDTRSGRLRDSV
ncbi:hypothetical protein [Actinacidiphila paucisporea]|uniref:Uncharacterized protein n=1 Tax=Actinacidiphila paucisporea TaxID=310782 RepID=A0A1M7HC08_9ACTN|nr:hypothetical protein [Actinacidiphila paucisporea]SHM25979.1 hypothetical protein SAMN05216499_109226 [Actinacidiphila paucisporea]